MVPPLGKACAQWRYQCQGNRQAVVHRRPESDGPTWRGPAGKFFNESQEFDRAAAPRSDRIAIPAGSSSQQFV
jgi:hypothetical protein